MIAAPGVRAQAAPSGARGSDPLRTVVDDYVGLYRKDTLAEWRKLFLPTFTSTSTNQDGTIIIRSLDEFYDSQASGFAREGDVGDAGERRHPAVPADRHRVGGLRIPPGWHVAAGRLVLTLVETEGVWRIASLMFSY